MSVRDLAKKAVMKRLILKPFRFQTIGRKISLVINCVIVATVLILVITALLIIHSQLLTQIEMNAAKSLQMVSEKLDMFYEQVENDAVMIITSDPIQALFRRLDEETEMDAMERHRLFRAINDNLASITGRRSDLYRCVIFFDLDGNAHVTGNIRPSEVLLEKKQEEILLFLNGEENSRWVSLHSSPWLIASQGTYIDCISYQRKVYSRYSGRLIGAIEMELNNHAILNLYRSITDSENHIFLLDSEGIVISSNDLSALRQNFEESIHSFGKTSEAITRNQDYFFFRHIYPTLGWSIVLAVSQIPYRESMQVIVIAGGVITILLLISVAFLSNKLIRSITSPIGSITNTIQRIGKGDYSQRVIVHTSDELQTLGYEFNRMIDKTNRLMEQIRSTEEKKREHELNLMQLQMTPHFFYNILESICGLVVLDDKLMAIKMVRHLSNFYRGVLGEGKEVITLKEELSIAEHYLEIMRVCYPDTFAYSIRVEEGLENCLINKLTLQPILENAVYHGIIASESEGYIDLYARLDGDTLCITVDDDGVGIPPHRLRMLHTKENRETMDSFGIRNTDERIKLYFGQDYGLEIQSIEKEGTTAIIRLPIVYLKGMDAYVPGFDRRRRGTHSQKNSFGY